MATEFLEDQFKYISQSWTVRTENDNLIEW